MQYPGITVTSAGKIGINNQISAFIALQESRFYIRINMALITGTNTISGDGGSYSVADNQALKCSIQ